MNINPDMDTLYSPSKWCRRFNGDGATKYFSDFIQRVSNNVRTKIPCQLNLSYGAEYHEKIDIFGFDLPKDAPIFVFVHGGYWQESSKDESCYMAQMFYQNGIKTIIIGFNLCPHVTVEGQVKEVTQGVKKSLELAEEWGAKKVVIAGHSSGAHVVACLLERLNQYTESQRKLIVGLLLVAGIYDIVPIVDTYANDLLFLTKDTARQISPMYKDIERNDIKIYVLVAEFESPAFIEQSEKYYEKLKKLNFKVELIKYKDHDHFTIMEDLVHDTYDMSKLIFSLLKN
ncbi:kynurenine formamidase-like [Chrysoperla carnea]|uniref:kynurenine formamidase-like n=1 Tax=Chrysoperla carnea TaxID=189513 RepID=UPI001D073AFE|nr:kynurenine formamidase-like [Chrysoperla carnea]